MASAADELKDCLEDYIEADDATRLTFEDYFAELTERVTENLEHIQEVSEEVQSLSDSIS